MKTRQLQIVLYREALSRGPIPYPFINYTLFGRKGTPLVSFYDKWYNGICSFVQQLREIKFAFRQ